MYSDDPIIFQQGGIELVKVGVNRPGTFVLTTSTIGLETMELGAVTSLSVTTSAISASIVDPWGSLTYAAKPAPTGINVGNTT